MAKTNKNPIKRQIKRYKRLFRLKKKKLIIIFCATAVMLIGCTAVLTMTTKSPQPVMEVLPSWNSASTVVRDFGQDFDINDTLSRFLSQQSSIEEVGGALGIPDVRSEDYLVYRNIPFGSHTAEVLFQFANGGLYKASVTFDPTDDTDFSKTRFDELYQILTDKFVKMFRYEEYAYAVWQTPDLTVNLNMSNHDHGSSTTTAVIYTANNAPEPTKPEKSECNADMDYDSLWGLNKRDVMNRLGIPDMSGEDYLVYKNISFGEYDSNVMYCFEAKHLSLVYAAFKHDADGHDKERFNGLYNLLTDRYDIPYEYSVPMTRGNSISGRSHWKLQNSSLILNMRPLLNDTSIVTAITYRHNPNYLFSDEQRNILGTFLSGEPEPTEPPVEIKRGTENNANIDYSAYFGMSLSDIESNFGTADVADINYLVYQNILFGAHSSELTFNFSEDVLDQVTVKFSSNDSIAAELKFDNLKELLINKFGVPSDVRSRSYAKWGTPNMNILLRISNPLVSYTRETTIIYTPDTSEQDEPAESAVPDRPVDDFTEKIDWTFNANINYDDYWGATMTDITNKFGSVYERKKSYDNSIDFIFYNNIKFGDYLSSVLYYFNYNDALSYITVTFPYMSEDADLKNCYVNLRQELNHVYGDAKDSESYSYTVWQTSETYVKLEMRNDNIFVYQQSIQ